MMHLIHTALFDGLQTHPEIGHAYFESKIWIFKLKFKIPNINTDQNKVFGYFRDG